MSRFAAETQAPSREAGLKAESNAQPCHACREQGFRRAWGENWMCSVCFWEFAHSDENSAGSVLGEKKPEELTVQQLQELWTEAAKQWAAKRRSR